MTRATYGFVLLLTASMLSEVDLSAQAPPNLKIELGSHVASSSPPAIVWDDPSYSNGATLPPAATCVIGASLEQGAPGWFDESWLVLMAEVSIDPGSVPFSVPSWLNPVGVPYNSSSLFTGEGRVVGVAPISEIASNPNVQISPSILKGLLIWALSSEGMLDWGQPVEPGLQRDGRTPWRAGVLNWFYHPGNPVLSVWTPTYAGVVGTNPATDPHLLCLSHLAEGAIPIQAPSAVAATDFIQSAQL